jgi:hypothetical protein
MYKNQVEVNINSVNCLPQDYVFLVSHHILKRMQKKINYLEFLLLSFIYYYTIPTINQKSVDN